MPFKKSYKKNVTKKYTKKPSAKKVVRASNTKRLVKLIKSVSLRNVETKSVHRIQENIDVNHNVGYIFTNLLKTQQGITDTDTGATAYTNRIGDEILAKGLNIKLWIANKKDRPNIMYRIGVFKYAAGSIPTLASLFTGANGNRIMDNMDSEYITMVYQKIFNLQVGYSASVADGSSTAYNREAHTYRKIWINLKDKKLIYNNGGSLPKFIDYGFFIVPYDSYGTLPTDTVSSFAFEQTLYFKDA